MSRRVRNTSITLDPSTRRLPDLHSITTIGDTIIVNVDTIIVEVHPDGSHHHLDIPADVTAIDSLDDLLVAATTTGILTIDR